MLKFRRMLPVGEVKGAFWYIMVHFLVIMNITTIIPILPLYYKLFVSNNAFVGYIAVYTGILLAIGALTTGKILKRFEKKPVLLTAITTLFLTNFVFMFIDNLVQLLILLFFRIWSVIIIWVVLALYIRDSVQRKSLGKAEGFFFVFLNIAFVIGPLMGGALAEAFNFNFVFGIAAVFPLLALILAGYKVKRDGKIDQDKHKIWNNIKDYFKKKDLIILYFLSLGLAIWWNLIYVFLPLFMVEMGMTEAIIGVVLLLVAVPLIILEFPAGKWADKYGEKRFFIIGYLILFFFSFIVFFVTNNYWILALFVIASAGGGFFEPLRDSYFFEKTSKRDSTRFYPVFTTSFDMGYVVGPAILSSVLFFTNFKTMFLVTSLLMLLFAIIAIFMTNSKK